MNQKIRTFVLNNSILRELFFFARKKKVNKKKIDKKIENRFFPFSKNQINAIVSLTSYGERISELQYTLYSLVVQSVRPKKILVNLAEKDYTNIPERLKEFEKYGVEFNKTEDLRSYKKLIPTLHQYPNEIIITADDDLFYPKYWLEKLWKGHLNYPNCVICHSTLHIETKNEEYSYKLWKYNKKFSAPSFDNFILSGAGALFPVKCFYKDISNKELFTDLAPLADDIWDYFMCILNKTKIMQIEKSYYNLCYVNPYREYGIIKGETLTQQNVYQNQNDKQIASIVSYYKIDLSSLI